MNGLKFALASLLFLLLPGCAAVPFGIGLIPGAPSYFSSVIGNGQTAYETAVDERDSRQQMLDAIIEGHAQAELYKDKDIRPAQITAYCYFGKLYLVGEYDSQKQLEKIYQCMDKVEDKRTVISRLYLKDDKDESSFLSEQAKITELETQLLADFEVTSSPVKVEVVHGDIILLGVISDKAERDKIMAHALASAGDGRVISYLYHSEIAGPSPRTMTAEILPAPAAVSPIPKAKKKSTPKRVKSKKTDKKVSEPARTKAVASNIPRPPEVVNGRVLGL
ncbi:BON domain-containing protein [Pseudodesulfovibrio cashew]|uniref:BON domain-containing protein n=1 Tax=Pseudodesulfovibrio cashew TaxID=2678688 RepID=A0A6I6JHM2_9BACT|nr:BON domain-containing protein [Pseudodesulfovibrio cashew]QGY40508.1 BON domain-containing protein [Pseudodesulfovibrio cashew]